MSIIHSVLALRLFALNIVFQNSLNVVLYDVLMEMDGYRSMHQLLDDAIVFD